MHRADRETREWMGVDAFAGALGKAPQAEIELDVGAFEPLVAARETAGADPVGRQRSGSKQHVLQTCRYFSQRVIGNVVQGNRLGAAKSQTDVKMILQIGA